MGIFYISFQQGRIVGYVQSGLHTAAGFNTAPGQPFNRFTAHIKATAKPQLI